jgi:pimeloyl-ACP methyl ester carboxylesterase
MSRPLLHLLIALALFAALLSGCGKTPQRVSAPQSAAGKPTIVIEHGAFADASGWDNVIGRLRRAGYTVVAPANPLRGVGSDAAYLKSVLATIQTPVVLVGHSYGGAVITNAGAPNVKALVYVAAIAMDKGESQADIFKRFPGSRLGPATTIQRAFSGGVDQYVKEEAFRDVFTADQPGAVAAKLAATQRPLTVAATTEESGPPAWRDRPSWYLVTKQDRAIPPAAQRFMAKRAHAHTVEVDSPHFVMLSHSDAVTELILDAAKGF